MSLNPNLKLWKRPFIGAQWLFLRSGPGATNHFEGGGFARSNDDVDYPNLMFHFLPIAVRYDGTAPAGGHGYQVHIGPMYSDARGRSRSRAPTPRRPAILFNYLSTDQDRREWVEADGGGPRHPGPAGLRAVQRRRDLARARGAAPTEEILEWVRHGRRDRATTPRAPVGWASTRCPWSIP